MLILLLILVLLVGIGVGVYLVWRCRNKKEGYSRKRFATHTTFKEIDEEHQEMADALEKFHQLCVKHWKTEERLYKEGKMKMPEGHPHDVNALWTEHSNEHKKFIARIEQMKSDIVAHVTKYDVPHFHYGPD
jgi:hypothetical protein